MRWFPIFLYILYSGIQAKHPNHTTSEELKPPSNLTDSGEVKRPSDYYKELYWYLRRMGKPIPWFRQRREDSSNSSTDVLHYNSIEILNSEKNRSDSLEPTTIPKTVEDKWTSKPGSNDSAPNETFKPGDHPKDHVKKNATGKEYYHNAMSVYNSRYFGTYTPLNPFKFSTATRFSTDSYYENGRWRHREPWGSRYGYTRPEGWFPSNRNPGKFDFYLQPIKSRMSEFHNQGWRSNRYRLLKVHPCLFCETGCHSHCHRKRSRKSAEKENEVQEPYPSEEIQGTIVDGSPKIQGQKLDSPSSKEEKLVEIDGKPFNISHYNLKHPHRLSHDIFEKIRKYFNGGKDFVYVVPGPPTPIYKPPKRPRPFWPITNRTE